MSHLSLVGKGNWVSGDVRWTVWVIHWLQEQRILNVGSNVKRSFIEHDIVPLVAFLEKTSHI